MVLNFENQIKKVQVSPNFANLKFFMENGCFLEAAYCLLLQENLSEAYKIFNSLKEKDIRAHWGCFLISLINGNVKDYPTYFELRNFLEIDLNLLINNYKGDYTEKILRYADFMFKINPEVYKFIGRVLYNNNMEDFAMTFLDCAKNYFYNDPELHYLIAFIHYNNKNYEKAKEASNNCLHVLPQYFPAVDMLRKLENI